jgi:arsenate reductase-like glutaredoxin family protein
MKIKLFISKHCLNCKEALDYFAEKDIPFEAIDVTYNQRLFNDMLELGGIATPFILIDDRPFHFFDRTKLDQMLEEKLR